MKYNIMKRLEDKNLKKKVFNKNSVSDNYKDEILDTRIIVSNIIEKARIQTINMINNSQQQTLPTKYL
jgi:hypothetical protein